MIAEILEAVAPANGRAKVEKRGALNKDIIAVIHKDFPIAVEQTKSIAYRFKGQTALGTIFNIYTFLRSEIQYQKDPDNRQDIRLPARFLRDKKGDCKTYSLFSASILYNLGMPAIFRYACYFGNGIPSHVYVVTRDEMGSELILDGVYKLFNEEKKYTSKSDYQMEVRTLSGHAETENINGWFSDVGNFVKRNVQSAVKDTKSAASSATSFVVRNVKSAVKDTGHAASAAGSFITRNVKSAFNDVKHVAALTFLAIPRLAFMGIVELNGHGFATKLSKVNQANLKSFWEALGGDFEKLVPAIRRGKDRRSILGPEDTIRINGIGEPVTIASAIAASAPIITAVVAFLKKNGASDADVEKVAAESIQNFQANTGGVNPVDIAQQALQESAAGGKSPEQAASSSSFSLTSPVVLIAAAGVVGLIFLTKSKRK
jgi:hypothetical protein